jgi:uroporphyrinogen decarboxylase
MNPLQRVLAGDALATPPIWLMRQAGRYQATYRALRKRHGFETLCREPELAARVALDAVDTFDFDAAILFSDLIFPLEALGFGLSYDTGPPVLDGRLTPARLRRFRATDDAAGRLAFQTEAVAATRASLSASKSLIGFVGGPWTLFVYALEGSHVGALTRAKSSPALYRAFARRVVPLLRRLIASQLSAGADVVMVLDTAAGELAASEFAGWLARDLDALAAAGPGRVGYYAKGLHPDQLAERRVAAIPWAGLGLDARWNLATALAAPRRRGFLQGNFDQSLLHLEGRALTSAVHRFLDPIRRLPVRRRRGWICGVGHGLVPGTPEASVHRFIHLVRETVR